MLAVNVERVEDDWRRMETGIEGKGRMVAGSSKKLGRDGSSKAGT
jgi:hypothetical protein